MSNKPHARNNIALLPKCGAYARRTGKPCRQPAMKNGRCRLHGGKSTGAKTAAGRARCGNWVHGRFSNLEKNRRKVIAKYLAKIAARLEHKS